MTVELIALAIIAASGIGAAWWIARVTRGAAAAESQREVLKDVDTAAEIRRDVVIDGDPAARLRDEWRAP